MMNMKVPIPTDPLDIDGYPTDEALDWISNHPWQSGHEELIEFIKNIWHWGDDMFTVEDTVDEIFNKPIRRYYISTGGWSGNECIISALKENHFFWSSCWVQSHKGGHYIFEVSR